MILKATKVQTDEVEREEDSGLNPRPVTIGHPFSELIDEVGRID